jgi:hypothetical protein
LNRQQLRLFDFSANFNQTQTPVVPGTLLLLQLPIQSPSVLQVQQGALRLLLLSNGSVQIPVEIPPTQKLKEDGKQTPEHEPSGLQVDPEGQLP